MRRWLLPILLLGLAALGYGLFEWAARPLPAPAVELDVAQVLGGDTQGFARALQPRPLRFPQDHGPHPDYRNEWWYFTGNLEDGRGRRFGFELTLFRIALTPHAPARASAWAAHQVYMGHFAVTDVANRRIRYYERFARGAAGLAGAQAAPLRVWLEDWSVTASADGPEIWQLRAGEGEAQIDLQLTPLKPVVLHGEQGLSRKSAAPGNASYYYSIPRLQARGSLRLGGEIFNVSGAAWLDREWSSSALAPEQAGWDWFGLQLDDGSELMFYRLRRKDGAIDPHSQGTWIDPHGRAWPLRNQDVGIAVLSEWESPRGGRYPARWRIRVKPLGLELEVAPLVADQELAVSVRYWEGAVAVSGQRAGKPVRGQGYAELTGYASAGRR